MDWLNYLSVLTPAGTGDLVLSLETFNAANNISLTLTVTSGAAQDEITYARSIHQQVQVQLIQASANYGGLPVFSDQAPYATFVLARTDHVVSFWSQAEFRLQVVSNAAGAEIQISSAPTFLTLSMASAMAPLVGVEFTDFNEVSLTESQIMLLLQMASDQIARLLNNNIVMSNYLHEHVGNMQGSMSLSKGPINTWDVPYIRRPYVILITAIPLGQTALSYTVLRKLKIVNYRFDNELIDTTDPFEMNNEIRMTYRAGLMNIPKIIQEKVLQISSLLLSDNNIKTLKGGSFAVEFRLPTEVLASIAVELRSYRNDSI